MNANEEMIAYSRYKQIGDENVYLMEKVRQQQAEIETLKNHGYRTQYELLRIEYGVLKSGIEKILEGCHNVKNEDDIPDDTKKIASLIIRDCNQALGKFKND